MFSVELFFKFIMSQRAGSLVRSIARIGLIGISFGVAALVLVISVMNGFNRSIQDKLIRIEPHVVVIYEGQPSFDEIEKTPEYQTILSEPGAVPQRVAQQDILLRTDEGKIHKATLKGITRETLSRLYHFMKDRESEFYGSAQDRKQQVDQLMAELKAGEVVLGRTLAELTGVFSENTITLIPPENLVQPLGEVPVFSSAVVRDFLLVEFEPIDKETVFYIQGESLPRLQHTTGIERGIEVFLKDPMDAKDLASRLRRKGIRVQTWIDRNATLFFALKLEKVVIAFLVGLSTLFAALSIVSVMMLLLIQKKRDIGNFLAMGMTPIRVKKLFMRLGTFLTTLGLLVGLFIGLVLCFVVDQFSDGLLPQFYEEQNIPAEVHPLQIALFLLALFVFTSLCLRWALRSLGRVNPSEALKS